MQCLEVHVRLATLIRVDPGLMNRYPSALGLRIITALILLSGVLGALVFLSPLQWSVFCVLGLVLAAREWAFLADFPKRLRFLFFFVICVFCIAFFAGYFGIPPKASPLTVHPSWLGILWAVAAIFWILFVPLLLFFQSFRRSHFGKFLAGLFMLLPAWGALACLKALNPIVLCVVFFSVWINDSAAYIAGSLFGERKIAPAISPGKTWEGALGAVFLLWLYWGVVLYFHSQKYMLGLACLAALATAYFGLIGDLFESCLKRQKGCKDSGHLFPGHGGMLDRMDAASAILPMAALFLWF